MAKQCFFRGSSVTDCTPDCQAWDQAWAEEGGCVVIKYMQCMSDKVLRSEVFISGPNIRYPDMQGKDNE